MSKINRTCSRIWDFTVIPFLGLLFLGPWGIFGGLAVACLIEIAFRKDKP